MSLRLLDIYRLNVEKLLDILCFLKYKSTLHSTYAGIGRHVWCSMTEKHRCSAL